MSYREVVRTGFFLALLTMSCGSRVELPDGSTTTPEPDSGVPSCSFVPAGGVAIELLEEGMLASENRTFRGSILVASGDSLTVDRCHPAADCISSLAELRVSGVTLNALPKGGFVEVSYEHIPTPWIGFTKRVMVRSIPDWGGMANPANTGDAVFVAAADGASEAPASAPFTVNREALPCPPIEATSACAYHKAYAFRFSSPRSAATVTMGSSASFDMGGVYELKVTNLRAFDSKCTDDYWNWSWTAVYAP